MKAVGLQSNCAAGCTVTGNANQVFASLSSVDYSTVGPHDYIQIITRGPSNGPGGGPQLSSTLIVSGAYGGKGRISEQDASGAIVNYDTFLNVFTRQVTGGDINMNGVTDDGDFNILLTNFNKPGKWYEGNIQDNGLTDIDDGDFALLISWFGATGAIGDAAGVSLGESNSIPEPSAAARVVLALALGCGRLRRSSDRRN
jgi:hypothetical protein